MSSQIEAALIQVVSVPNNWEARIARRGGGVAGI